MKFHKRITSLLEQNRDETRAAQMSKYMRNLFPFYGINKPVLERLLKSLKTAGELPDFNQMHETVESLYAEEYRESHHIALEILKLYRKQLTPAHLPWIESLIIRNSWWDSVDILAPSIAGTILRNHPEFLEKTLTDWNQQENIWLIRSSIIAQLKFRTLTDVDLLFRLILPHTGNSEFFIAKAIGWALREYSKTDATVVAQFVEKTPMQNLSKREALKRIKPNTF